MSRCRTLFFGLVCCLAMLACIGCAGTPDRRLSATEAEAVRRNQQGVREAEKGDRAAALVQFAEALRLHTTIDNTDGMAVALVNISRVSRLSGDLATARAAMERATGLVGKKGEFAAELHFEWAKIALAEGDLPAAEEIAKRSISAAGGDNAVGRNLMALVMFRQGKLDEALRHGEIAWEQSRKMGKESEEANAQRFLGDVRLAKGELQKAAESYENALSLDKRLGRTKKVAEDLRGLGETAVKAENLSAAIDYYRRAFEGTLAGGDKAQALLELARLAELYEKSGEAEKARKAREEMRRLRGEADGHGQ